MTKGGLRAAGDYCFSLVKQADFDNYLSGLLIPKAYRGAYFALRAYNVELATMKDNSNSNAAAARIRFQWWRDTIENIYNGGGVEGQQYLKHPVAYALSYYCKEHGLTRHWLERSLDARQKDALGGHHETMDDLENYAEYGHSSILYLILESMNVRDPQSMYMASHIGVCSGLTTALRGFPYHVSKRQVYIPMETIRKRSITAGQILSGPPETAQLREALQDCIYEVASQAYGHLDRARSLIEDKQDATKIVHRDAIHICAPAVRSALFLETLRINNFNPYHKEIHDKRVTYQLLLLKMRFFKSF